jgi:hypothetical protein
MAVDLVTQSNMNVAQSPFEFRNCGVIPFGEPTFEEWQSALDFAVNADKSIHFWIGDILNYGEKRPWGKRYEEAIEKTGFDYQTLMDDKWVAASVQFSSRKENLSFSHHKVVAPYAPQEQAILLEKAETMGLSVTQLRKQREGLLPKGVQPGQWWKLGRHYLYCGDSASDDFTKRLKDVSFVFADPPYNAGVDVWDSDFEWKHDYLSEVAPIVAVTPGISAIKDFMGNTTMPYQWSMAYWIDNGMTRGALGFGNWIYVALFSEQSLYRNEQDVERIPADSERISITGGDRDALKHKGRKPISLLKHILSLFTEPNQTVVDPFLGTGTTLIACEQEGRSCIGAEVNVEYCEYIIKKWEKEAEQEAEAMEWQ